jgi:putrescine transport system permease protein
MALLEIAGVSKRFGAVIAVDDVSLTVERGTLLALLGLLGLVIASLVTGPSATTLPMAVFSSVSLGVSPEVNALATLFLAVVFALVSLAFWLMARADRRRGACTHCLPCERREARAGDGRA